MAYQWDIVVNEAPQMQLYNNIVELQEQDRKDGEESEGALYHVTLPFYWDPSYMILMIDCVGLFRSVLINILSRYRVLDSMLNMKMLQC